MDTQAHTQSIKFDADGQPQNLPETSEDAPVVLFGIELGADPFGPIVGFWDNEAQQFVDANTCAPIPSDVEIGWYQSLAPHPVRSFEPPTVNNEVL